MFKKNYIYLIYIMQITRNTYIFTLILLCLTYFYMFSKHSNEFVENFQNELNPKNYDVIENDKFTDKMDQIIEFPMNKDLLYNEIDMIKWSQNMPMHEFTGYFTDVNSYLKNNVVNNKN